MQKSASKSRDAEAITFSISQHQEVVFPSLKTVHEVELNENLTEYIS